MNDDELTPEELQQIEIMKKAILRRILTKEAKERLSRVKMVKPELATNLELYLIQMYQANNIKSVIDDNQLKTILGSISSKKRYRIK